jgi:hypothetical protein
MNHIRQSFINSVRSNRHCVFCQRSGHTITNCNASGLSVTLEVLKNIKHNGSQLSLDQNKRRVEAFIVSGSISTPVIKYTAVRYCNGRMDDDFDVIVQKILNYLFDPINTILTADDFIPFSRNLNQEFSEETKETTNTIETKYIDKTLKNDLKNDLKNNDCEKVTCLVCYEEITDQTKIKLNCNHEYCSDCLINWLKVATVKNCPMCRINIISMEYYNLTILENLPAL